LNRYYGVFEDGRIKMRGIEARRGDTPPFVEKAQIEMIKVLRSASSHEEFVAKIPEALHVLREYAKRLVKGQVEVNDLLVTKRLSKHPSRYAHDVFQAIAAKQLVNAGFEVHAGQKVQYLIVDSDNRSVYRRVRAAQLLEAKAKFDVEKYLELLISAADTLFSVFGYDSRKISSQVLHRERQTVLS
jgi:DNA polymerase-2